MSDEKMTLEEQKLAIIERLNSDQCKDELDLSGLNLHHVNLRDANLQYADLCDADLWRANLCRAHLNGASLVWASLEYAELFNANLERANLHRTILKDAYFYNDDQLVTNIKNADLSQYNVCGYGEGFNWDSFNNANGSKEKWSRRHD